MDFNVSKQAVNVIKSGISRFLVLLFYLFIAEVAADNPHTITKNTTHVFCNNCHIADVSLVSKALRVVETKNNQYSADHFKLNGIDMCVSCHDPEKVHKVGLHIDFLLPADLPLDAESKMICLTCHYVHGSLNSNRPQASFSFLDRFLDAERLHKSFLLRRNNVDGELCLICHHVSGSK